MRIPGHQRNEGDGAAAAGDIEFIAGRRGNGKAAGLQRPPGPVLAEGHFLCVDPGKKEAPPAFRGVGQQGAGRHLAVGGNVPQH